MRWWKRRKTESLSEWFRVRWDDSAVHLDVRPPGQDAWSATIHWEAVTRVCFQTESPTLSDDIYVFTRERAESYLIPMDAGGGHELWDELVRRGLFDAELAATALTAVDGLFCWPPLDEEGDLEPD